MYCLNPTDFCIAVRLLTHWSSTYKPEKRRRIMPSVCKVMSKTEHSTCHGCPVQLLNISYEVLF